MVWAILNEDQNAALRETMKSDSDRITAILGGAILDDSLRRNIEDRFRPGKDMNDKIFKISGPLGNLGPKIDLGYQLYMFEKPMRNAMYGINEIRNLFAHSMSMTLASPDKKMTDAFGKLKLHETETKYRHPAMAYDDKLYDLSKIYDVEPVTDRKSQYLVNLKLCLMWLMGDASRHSPHSNVPLSLQISLLSTPSEPNTLPHK